MHHRAVHVRGGLIASVAPGAPGVDRNVLAKRLLAGRPLPLLDFGDAVLAPGLVDVHVHMNEPGREGWEGALAGPGNFWLAGWLAGCGWQCTMPEPMGNQAAAVPLCCEVSATKPSLQYTCCAGMATATRAAAAGGVTTVVDMPLNSAPCTTSTYELRRKSAAAAAANKTFVDVAFWAGLVPANAHSPSQLKALVKGGALGFKAFMSPSGIDDFPNVSVADVAAALPTIRALGVPLLVHAELVDSDVPAGVRLGRRDCDVVILSGGEGGGNGEGICCQQVAAVFVAHCCKPTTIRSFAQPAGRPAAARHLAGLPPPPL